MCYKMVCLSKARINRHWHRQHHLKGVATLGNKQNSTWTTRNVGYVNSKERQPELEGTNPLVLAQPQLEGTMTFKSELERQRQTILNSHFLTVKLMTGTLYLILLCQLPVWIFLKLDYLIIFVLSCIVFSIIIYCIWTVFLNFILLSSSFSVFFFCLMCGHAFDICSFVFFFFTSLSLESSFYMGIQFPRLLSFTFCTYLDIIF